MIKAIARQNGDDAVGVDRWMDVNEESLVDEGPKWLAGSTRRATAATAATATHKRIAPGTVVHIILHV